MTALQALNSISEVFVNLFKVFANLGEKERQRKEKIGELFLKTSDIINKMKVKFEDDLEPVEAGNELGAIIQEFQRYAEQVMEENAADEIIKNLKSINNQAVEVDVLIRAKRFIDVDANYAAEKAKLIRNMERLSGKLNGYSAIIKTEASQ